MSRQESATEVGRGEEGEGGPGLVYMPFVVMEDLLDKLKLLHYEQEFVAELKMRPLNRHYFVLQTNPGEQFFMFTSLAAWLIRKAGTRFDPPQETDDPNTTISNILEQLRKVGVTIDFAPSKLKQGFGEQAIFVLDRLSDEALKAAQFHWSSPIPPSDDLPQVYFVCIRLRSFSQMRIRTRRWKMMQSFFWREWRRRWLRSTPRRKMGGLSQKYLRSTVLRVP